ncbi:hypothetical protein EDC01DRAFT_376447 [Geopyxis carbonaria]|nr:hypothetical protein EDC01DRAFT_376447 [Geopyxis carbonaria]
MTLWHRATAVFSLDAMPVSRCFLLLPCMGASMGCRVRIEAVFCGTHLTNGWMFSERAAWATAATRFGFGFCAFQPFSPSSRNVDTPSTAASVFSPSFAETRRARMQKVRRSLGMLSGMAFDGQQSIA